MQKLLTTDQVAETLGVPVATLYSWRHKRIGPRAIRVGRHLRYRPTDLELWLEGQAGEGAPDAA